MNADVAVGSISNKCFCFSFYFQPVDENMTREESDKRIEKLRKVSWLK